MALNIFFLFSGCAEPERELPFSPPSLSFEELKQRVSRIRGLPFRENREEALEFYRSYQKAVEKRYGVTLEKSPTKADTLLLPPQSGPALLLQAKDEFVFFLDGVPPPRCVEIAERLWRELETGTEERRTPFDLAGRIR